MKPRAVSSRPPWRSDLLFRREPGWQFSLLLALQAAFLFIVVPAFSSGDLDYNAVALVQLALAAAAIALLARSAWLRTALAVSFILTILARLAPGNSSHVVTLGMSAAYDVLVTAAMARAVFGPGDVNHHRIAGAVFVYLNVAVLFALAFSMLILAAPDSLTSLPDNRRTSAADLIHLSFTSLTAIGTSPISLASPFARSLADLETIVGQLFPAILLSRLVGLHLSRKG